MIPDQNVDEATETLQPVTRMSHRSALWIVVTLAMLILVVSVGYDVRDDHAVIIRTEQDRLVTQARVIESNLEGQITSVVGVLHSLAKNPASPELNRRLSDLELAMPGVRTLLILDKNGRAVAANRKDLLQKDFSYRDYFTIHRTQLDFNRLYVSPPFVSVLNNYVITLSMSLPGADGAFNGVICAALDPDYFNLLLNSVRYSNDMRCSITHGDGLLFMMIPQTSGVAGSNLAVPGSLFTRHLQSGKSENMFSGASFVAGGNRVVAMRTFNPPQLHLSKPLIIAVSRDLGTVMGDWRRELFLKCLAVFILSGFMLLGSYLVLQRQRKLDQQTQLLLDERNLARNELTRSQELQKSYERLELMQEVAQYHATNVQELLDFSLEKVINLTESRIGYIYHYSEDTKEFVLNTWSKDVMASCRVAEPQSLYQLEKTGIWGEVVRQRTSIIVNEFSAENPLKKGYPEGHVHLSRFMSIPIFDADMIVAVVGVANKVLPYDQTDLLQLSLMMEGVWKIATRLKLEAQILRAGHEWQSTFDSITDSIALIDAHQTILRCNLATSLLLGRDFSDVIGQPCWKLFHDADAPIDDCPMNRARLSLVTETSTIKHQDRWLEVIVDPILSDQGDMTGGVHIVRDVTERIALERALQKQASVMRGVLESTGSAVFSVDTSFCYSSYNSAHEGIMKALYNADIQPGNSILSFMTSEDAAVAQANLERALAGETFVVEADSGDHDHLRSIFEISHNPIRNAKGVIEGVAVFARDISERKQSEAAFREMQAQMMQNDKLATIGQLAAGVAHEINNPMGFVGSNMMTLAKYIEKYNRYIDLIEVELRAISSGELPEQVQELRQSLKLDYIMRDISVLVDECNEGIDRIKRIVQDLRTFSRADISAVGNADLNNCMDSTINIVINEIKYVAELQRYYSELPKVACNSQQINQVFMNLLINAAHAIQAKGEEIGEIAIRTWCDQDNAFVSVSDTGCGIAPENQSRIFDAFYTTKDVGKGTGLGLSISAGIIRKHEGDITLSSEVGVGSTFTIRLPLSQSQQTAKEL